MQANPLVHSMPEECSFTKTRLPSLMLLQLKSNKSFLLLLLFFLLFRLFDSFMSYTTDLPSYERSTVFQECQLLCSVFFSCEMKRSKHFFLPLHSHTFFFLSIFAKRKINSICSFIFLFGVKAAARKKELRLSCRLRSKIWNNIRGVFFVKNPNCNGSSTFRFHFIHENKRSINPLIACPNYRSASSKKNLISFPTFLSSCLFFLLFFFSSFRERQKLLRNALEENFLREKLARCRLIF